MEVIEPEGSPDKIKEMKQSQKEIESKVGKMLKLIKTNGQEKKGKFTEKKKSELIDLIEDFHKQYQSLHIQYGSLKDEVGNKPVAKATSSSSSSDSDYYSSEEVTQSPRKPRGEAGSSRTPRKRKEHEGGSSRIDAEIESQIRRMKAELESLQSDKKDLVEQIENKGAEAKLSEEKTAKLEARISELETKEPDVLQQELDSIRSQKTELEFQLNLKSKTIAESLIQIDTLQNEKEGIHLQNKNLESKVQVLSNEVHELEALMKSKTQEADQLRDDNAILNARVSELEGNGKPEEEEESAEMDSVWEEIHKKATTGKTLQDEREDFNLQTKGLESKSQSLSEEINKLEEMVKSKNCEVDRLQDKNEFLNVKVSELEQLLENRGDEMSSFQEMNDRRQNEVSAQIMALNSHIKRMQQELSSLTSEKSQLDHLNEKLKQDLGQSQNSAKDKIRSLTTKIETQQRLMKEQQETVKKLMEERRPIRHASLDTHATTTKPRMFDSPRVNLHSIERKVEDVSEKFHHQMENHFRILNQRILVAEQIQQETIDEYKKAKEGFDLENKELIETMSMCEHEAGKILEEILEHGNLRTGLDSDTPWKPEDDSRKFLSRITKLLNEIRVTRSWIAGINDEIRKLKHNVEDLKAQMEVKDHKEMLLIEKTIKLEENLKKEGGDKMQLKRTVEEKDEVFARIAEEKREAIRQLCMLIDYHRDRHDQLREAMSKSSVRTVKKKP